MRTDWEGKLNSKKDFQDLLENDWNMCCAEPARWTPSHPSPRNYHKPTLSTAWHIFYKLPNSKKDFQDLLLEIINPLLPYYSEGKAELILGVTATNYDQKAIRLEAFSRPLWGLVPF